MFALHLRHGGKKGGRIGEWQREETGGDVGAQNKKQNKQQLPGKETLLIGLAFRLSFNGN